MFEGQAGRQVDRGEGYMVHAVGARTGSRTMSCMAQVVGPYCTVLAVAGLFPGLLRWSPDSARSCRAGPGRTKGAAGPGFECL